VHSGIAKPEMQSGFYVNGIINPVYLYFGIINPEERKLPLPLCETILSILEKPSRIEISRVSVCGDTNRGDIMKYLKGLIHPMFYVLIEH
jgi:hypothetical protein